MNYTFDPVSFCGGVVLTLIIVSVGVSIWMFFHRRSRQPLTAVTGRLRLTLEDWSPNTQMKLPSGHRVDEIYKLDGERMLIVDGIFARALVDPSSGNFVSWTWTTALGTPLTREDLESIFRPS
jgi:hypothetical protein